MDRSLGPFGRSPCTGSFLFDRVTRYFVSISMEDKDIQANFQGPN